jgi:MOSC domain-containing protein YiiM
MKIISLNVALPSTQRYKGQEVLTGGAKGAVSRARLRSHNFDGDGQADLVNHSELEKAVCVYPLDHYAYWQRVLDFELEPGAFSENLTISDALETEVCIGDVFKFGEAVAQVCQARQPCNKLAGKNGQKLLPKWMVRTGYTGFYMRVLSEGVVYMGDAFERIERHQVRMTIADVNDVTYKRSYDLTLIEQLTNFPEYPAVGRAPFAERFEHLRRRQQTEEVSR